MKALFHREGLLSAVQLASVAAASKDVKPILRNIKAVLEGDRCTLMATNLEMGIRLEMNGIQVEQAGQAILPAARFAAILRESTDEHIQVEANADRCQVRGHSTEFEMPSDDPAQFPDVPTFADNKYHEVQAGLLRNMIRRTIFAAASENARYAVTGILWELEPNQVRLVATDGRRLAIMHGPAIDHGSQDMTGQTPVVPRDAMGLLERVLQNPEELVKVNLRPNEALFKTERATIYTRLVEGRYPAYREVIPKKTTMKVPLTAGPFLTAVRQASIMTDEESKRVAFQFSKKTLTLQAHGAGSGHSKVELAIDTDGKNLEINFDPKFLMDMLRVLEPDAALTLELVNGESPGLFRNGDDYIYVVVPMG